MAVEPNVVEVITLNRKLSQSHEPDAPKEVTSPNYDIITEDFELIDTMPTLIEQTSTNSVQNDQTNQEP